MASRRSPAASHSTIFKMLNQLFMEAWKLEVYVGAWLRRDAIASYVCPIP